MKKILAFVLMMACSGMAVAQSGDDGFIENLKAAYSDFNFESPEKQWITAGGFSRHAGSRIDNGGEYNETNPGLGYEWQANERVNYSFGYFKNSYAKDSFFATTFYSPYSIGKVRIGLVLGAVTGYPENPVLPMILPTAMVEFEHFGLNVAYSPSFSRGGKKVSSDALMFQLKFAF